MQLLEASKLHSIHLEHSAPPSTAFFLESGVGQREAGVRGRRGETTTEFFSGTMARPLGRQ